MSKDPAEQLLELAWSLEDIAECPGSEPTNLVTLLKDTADKLREVCRYLKDEGLESLAKWLKQEHQMLVEGATRLDALAEETDRAGENPSCRAHAQAYSGWVYRLAFALRQIDAGKLVNPPKAAGSAGNKRDTPALPKRYPPFEDATPDDLLKTFTDWLRLPHLVKAAIASKNETEATVLAIEFIQASALTQLSAISNHILLEPISWYDFAMDIQIVDGVAVYNGPPGFDDEVHPSYRLRAEGIAEGSTQADAIALLGKLQAIYHTTKAATEDKRADRQAGPAADHREIPWHSEFFIAKRWARLSGQKLTDRLEAIAEGFYEWADHVPITSPVGFDSASTPSNWFLLTPCIVHTRGVLIELEAKGHAALASRVERYMDKLEEVSSELDEMHGAPASIDAAREHTLIHLAREQAVLLHDTILAIRRLIPKEDSPPMPKADMTEQPPAKGVARKDKMKPARPLCKDIITQDSMAEGIGGWEDLKDWMHDEGYSFDSLYREVDGHELGTVIDTLAQHARKAWKVCERCLEVPADGVPDEDDCEFLSAVKDEAWEFMQGWWDALNHALHAAQWLYRVLGPTRDIALLDRLAKAMWGPWEEITRSGCYALMLIEQPEHWSSDHLDEVRAVANRQIQAKGLLRTSVEALYQLAKELRGLDNGNHLRRKAVLEAAVTLTSHTTMPHGRQTPLGTDDGVSCEHRHEQCGWCNLKEWVREECDHNGTTFPETHREADGRELASVFDSLIIQARKALTAITRQWEGPDQEDGTISGREDLKAAEACMARCWRTFASMLESEAWLIKNHGPKRADELLDLSADALWGIWGAMIDWPSEPSVVSGVESGLVDAAPGQTNGQKWIHAIQGACEQLHDVATQIAGAMAATFKRVAARQQDNRRNNVQAQRGSDYLLLMGPPCYLSNANSGRVNGCRQGIRMSYDLVIYNAGSLKLPVSLENLVAELRKGSVQVLESRIEARAVLRDGHHGFAVLAGWEKADPDDLEPDEVGSPLAHEHVTMGIPAWANKASIGLALRAAMDLCRSFGLASYDPQLSRHNLTGEDLGLLENSFTQYAVKAARDAAAKQSPLVVVEGEKEWSSVTSSAVTYVVRPWESHSSSECAGHLSNAETLESLHWWYRWADECSCYLDEVDQERYLEDCAYWLVSDWIATWVGWMGFSSARFIEAAKLYWAYSHTLKNITTPESILRVINRDGGPNTKEKEILGEAMEAFHALRVEMLRARALETENLASNESPSKNSKPPEPAPEGEWSLPMSKTDMRIRLGNMAKDKFETFADQYGMKKINRQIFQIRLDTMDSRTRRRLETGK